MQDCIFCKLVKGEIPCSKIFEDENFLSFLDINPLVKGHTLVIPKKHFEKYHDIDLELLSKYAQTIKKIVKAVMKGTRSEGYTLGMANSPAAGQTVPHAHFHIIPRFKGDNAYKAKFQWTTEDTLKYEEGEMKKYVEMIKKNL